MKRLSALLLALLLSSCAQQRPTAAQSTQQQFQTEVRQQTEICQRRYIEDKQLDPLRSKIALSDAKLVTASMLANNEQPNEAEKAAIIVFDQAARQCAADGSALFRRYNVAMPAAVQTAISQGLILRGDLLGGRITYAQFNAERLRIALEVDKGIQTLAEKERLEAMRRAEEQARRDAEGRAALGALGQEMMRKQEAERQRFIDNARMSSQTIRMPNGRIINCTTTGTDTDCR